MTLKELKSVLRARPDAQPRFVLPEGGRVPAHFHVTEVGHITKRFIDCGGTLHAATDTCLLQTYVADDWEHRLDAGTLARILDLGEQILPHDDLEVEVEYEDRGVSQYPIASAGDEGEAILLQLAGKHTDCLAKEKCGIDGGCCGGDSAPTSAKTAAAGCC